MALERDVLERLVFASGESFAAALVTHPDGLPVICINQVLVTEAWQDEAITSWARALLHAGRRYGVMSAADLAGVDALN
jgi:hypothetical protein